MISTKEKILDTVLGSETKARVLRFLLRHPSKAFKLGEIARIINQNYNTTASFIDDLECVGIIQKSSTKDSASAIYGINSNFRNYEELRDFCLKTFPVSTEILIKELKEAGKIRLAILQGVFLNQGAVNIDFFVVADDMEDKKFEKVVKGLEADVGQELNYTLMNTSEFTYRYNIYDRFVRNILKRKHITIIDDLKLQAN